MRHTPSNFLKNWDVNSVIEAWIKLGVTVIKSCNPITSESNYLKDFFCESAICNIFVQIHPVYPVSLNLSVIPRGKKEERPFPTHLVIFAFSQDKLLGL